jgi:hypothetical protein
MSAEISIFIAEHHKRPIDAVTRRRRRARGQLGDRDAQVLLAEQAQRQEPPGVLVRRFGPPGGERGEQRQPGGVRGQVLREVADPCRPACGARVRFQVAGDDAQQRRLARAVVAGDQQPLPGGADLPAELRLAGAAVLAAQPGVRRWRR